MVLESFGAASPLPFSVEGVQGQEELYRVAHYESLGRARASFPVAVEQVLQSLGKLPKPACRH